MSALPLLCCFYLLLSVPTHAEEPATEIRELRVAVLAFRGSERALRRWAPTMTYLSQHIPDYRFRAIPMDLEQLDRAVAEEGVDFVITNSGQYVRAGAKHGLSWLATLKSRRHPGRDRVIGSVLTVRTDSNYQALEDLRQSRLGAVSPLAFGGFQIYWGELAKQGLRPESYFSELRFSDFPVDALAFWVRDGMVDAAVLPACLLENMAEQGLINLAEFRVIDARKVPGFNCQTSTELYPNWSFAKLKSTPSGLAEQVARVLLQLPAESLAAARAGSLGWTTPVSSYDIHQLYQRLQIHPLQQPWWLSMSSWLWRYWQWSLAAVVLLMLGFTHHLWVQLLVHKRTRQLELANAEVRTQQEQLEHAQRVAILGELASDLAHELNQPLAAINSFAEGGIIRIEPTTDDKDLAGLLKRISAEAQRGAGIIERIRGFARKDHITRETVDLCALVNETLNLLGYELKKQPLRLELDLPPPPLLASIDPVEIQQLVVNLIRNALEAMSGQASQRLRVALAVLPPDRLLITVEDAGPGVHPQLIEQCFKPFFSTKKNGLGLGMSICSRIVEAHGGNISMSAPEQGGTRVTCILSRGDYE